MSFSTPHQSPKMVIKTPTMKLFCIKLMTGDCELTTTCTAVALAERSAEVVLFQRLAPVFPPTQNVDSAPRSLTSACHFSENHAIYATNAVTTATFATF